jgi:ubiquinone biosynthesis protein UbiJ
LVGFLHFDEQFVDKLHVRTNHGVLGWQRQYNGTTNITELRDLAVQGNLHRILDAKLLYQHAHVSSTEDLIVVLTARALVVSHVFHDAQYPHL